MISNIIIPDLGATGSDVSLMEWFVEPGDRVLAGQPLFIVETDKATVEVESFRDGLVRLLLVEAGAVVSLGSVVAVIADSMEEPLVEEPASKHSPIPERKPATLSNHPDQPLSRQQERILASPLARRMAQVESIDLDLVTGTGRLGQILKRDLERVLNQTGIGAGPLASHRLEPVSPMRRAIAQRAARSKAEAPHFYASITVDMSAALALRREIVALAEEKGRIAPSITDLCLRATALALVDFPSLNASFREEVIIYYETINVGLVVGLRSGGMLVPVVHQADLYNLYDLAALTLRLRERAEEGTLSSSELGDGTFTLSNLGMYGLDSFLAVINPPQAGILALGAVQELPAVIDDIIVPKPLMRAALSADHRLVDGIVAAQFMAAWKEFLENPYRLTL
ncbi:MAG: dihydrolipoamide acetyltransferase family protein [Candidatus Promineifilaceae bacterium]